MNYFIIYRSKTPIALMTSVGAMPMCALHEPKTISYFDDKRIRRVSLEEFNLIRNQHDDYE